MIEMKTEIPLKTVGPTRFPKMNNKGFAMAEIVVSTILIAFIAVALVGVVSLMAGVNEDSNQFGSDTINMVEAVSGSTLTDSGREIKIIVTDKNNASTLNEEVTLKEYVAASDSGELKYYVDSESALDRSDE